MTTMTPKTCVTSYATPTTVLSTPITPPDSGLVTPLYTPTSSMATPHLPFGYPFGPVSSGLFAPVCIPSSIANIPIFTDVVAQLIQSSQAALVSHYLLNSEALNTFASTACSFPSFLPSSQAYSPLGSGFLSFPTVSETAAGSLPSSTASSPLSLVGPGLGIACGSTDEFVFKKPLEPVSSRKRKLIDDEMTDFPTQLSISEISEVIMQKQVDQLNVSTGKSARVARKYTRRMEKSEEEQDRRKRNLEAVRKHRARINENIEILPQAIKLLNDKKEKLDKELDELTSKFNFIESQLKENNSSLYSKWLEQERRLSIAV